MRPAPYRALTLAIHPNSRGFGWIAFESPFSIHSFGNVGARGADKNEQCLRCIERLVDRLTPEVVVLELFEDGSRSRVDRIIKLGRAIVALSFGASCEVAVYRHLDVRQSFAHLGAATRHEIAEAVARLFPQLRRHLPRKRKPWESERWRLSLFCAAALALTHYQRDASRLLDDLATGAAP